MKVQFTGKLWRWKGDAPAAWYFITLPPEAAAQVRFVSGKAKVFGSIRIIAQIGSTRWKTSLFPDKTTGSFLLPVKAAVRQSENLEIDKIITVNFGLDA
jgi:hypothetical protein